VSIAERTVLRHLPIDSIKVEGRHRKKMGDLDGLAASIVQVGLLQPIVIGADQTLIAGQRRLEACRKLGWADVPVLTVSHLGDARLALIAEQDENTCREEMAVLEKASLGRAIEAMEKPKAKERQKELGRTHGTPSGPGPEGAAPEHTGETRDIVGAAVGLSGSSYHRVKVVLEAAEGSSHESVREVAAEALTEIEATGKIVPAYNKVRRAIQAATATNGKPAKKKPGARRMAVQGENVESRTRRAVALGGDRESARKAVGLTDSTYREASYIVLLADDPEIDGADRSTATAALAAMNEDGHTGRAYPMVERLVNARFGPPSQRGKRKPARAAKVRMDDFMRAYGTLVQACMSCRGLEIPLLSADRVGDFVIELDEAIDALSSFRRRIQETVS
jgi:hypothetical protein